MAQPSHRAKVSVGLSVVMFRNTNSLLASFFPQWQAGVSSGWGLLIVGPEPLMTSS
jgi:hypothetical protein